MHRVVTGLVFAALLTACGGIPLTSMPRLMKMQNELLDADPAEFALAIQADARMTPRSDSTPFLQVSIQPAEAGAFAPVEKKLPLHLAVTSTSAPGLAEPSADRRWLVYRFPPEAQAELARLQRDFKRIQIERRGKSGGSVRVGIHQDGVAPTDPALANTRWESWLQMSRRDGYFELWSGTVAALLQQAEMARAKDTE
ncbi:MAG: hypothetical protein IPL51_07040 [Candidatus Competibacteraceae bacterium]|nr:hypothetical protein [Candidatus Competibacteraceae bacterium]